MVLENAIRSLGRRAFYALPLIEPVYRICQRYVDLYNAEWDTNFESNGERHFLEAHARDLATCLDVGAHTGEWTAMVLTLRKDSAIHCFEPCSATFGRLEQAGFGPQVRLNRLAVSNANATALMHILPRGDTGNSLHAASGRDDSDAAEGPSELVPTVTLDDYCQREGLSTIDLVKIDTEGHEPFVLEGARRLLQTGAIQRVQFEYGEKYIDSKRLLREIFALLQPLGYTVYQIAHDGLIALPSWTTAVENYRYKNLVAFHASVSPRGRIFHRRRR